ncbi:FAD-dependent monooxygenase [Candidatus Micrarchaeota archaeon]|nr:FAD-dependent monooxygenase [Candidatus Micrarchaeota archaeon]
MRSDVLVVGASVVGGVAAKELAQKGIQTTLLSDKAHVGKDGKCTSIISASGLEKTGIGFREALVHEIFGANIRCGKARLEVRTKKPVAHVLDRFQLDALSVSQAQDAGAELVTDARFSAWHEKTAQTKAGKIRAQFLVGADGVGSTVAAVCGFPKLSNLVVAWEGEFEGATLVDPRVVDVFLDYPGLFAWAVPAGPKTVRIGLAVRPPHDLASHKKRLLFDAVVERMRSGSVLAREFYHAIPLSYRRKTQLGDVCLVGDAAGQAKATTGGGIVFGSLCARELATSIKDHLGGTPLDYEARWRKTYAGTLDAHRWIRKTLDVLPWGVSAFGLSALSAIGFGGFLEKKGDMDFIVKSGSGVA